MAKKEQVTIEDVRLLKREQVAELLGLSVDTLDRWAGKKKGPRFIRFGPREVRYRLVDILAWQSLLEAMEPKEL